MFPVLREDRHLVCVNGWTRLGMLADLTFSFSAGANGDPHAVRKGLSYASHLLFIENEHAQDRAAPMPKISVRMLSPQGDTDAIARLKDDKVGPVAVFDDPCWFESSGKRCDAEMERTKGAAPASATASSEPNDDEADFPASDAKGAHARKDHGRLTGARVSAKSKGDDRPEESPNPRREARPRRP
jgi:hypothetical protein